MSMDAHARPPERRRIARSSAGWTKPRADFWRVTMREPESRSWWTRTTGYPLPRPAQPMSRRPEPISLGSPRFRTVDLPGLQISDVWFPPGAHLKTHTHDRAVFAVAIEGSIDSRMSRHTLECDKTSVWTEPAGESHQNRVGRAGARVLAILPEADEAMLGHCAPLLDEVNHLRHGGVADLARRMVSEMRQADAPSRLTVHGLALEALAIGLRERSSLDRHSSLPPWLEMARDIVHDRFREGLEIGEIAELAGVDATRLAREFRHRFGVPLGRYQRKLRLDWAADQLRTTDAPLSVVALQAGFYDQAHFNRHFRRRMGRTPGAYRSEFRGGRRG